MVDKIICSVILLAIILCNVARGQFQENINIMDMRLRGRLLSTLSTERVPVMDNNNPINISVGIEMKKIIQVNEVEQKFTTQVWLRLSWTNEFLKWNPEEWENIAWIKVKPVELWTPDIVPYHYLDEENIAEKYDKLIMVDSNGTNHWYLPLVSTLACDVRLQYFPFDVQKCSVVLGSWDYDSRALVLSRDPYPILTPHYKESAEWNLLDVSFESNMVKYPCCKQPYSVVSFTFVVHRRSAYFINNVIIPCTILMVVLLTTFFLRPGSGERIAVVITILLILCFFLQFINSITPRNSNTTPMLSRYYITVLVESMLLLLTTCVVIAVHNRGSEPWATPVPQWIKKILFRIFQEKLVSNDADDVLSTNNSKKDPSDTEQLLSTLSRNRCSSNTSFNGAKIVDLKAPLPNANKDQGDNTVLCGILNELKFVSTEFHNRREIEQKEMEWKYLSRCLDWLFFFVFLCLFFFTSLLFLVPAYLQYNEYVE